MKRMELATDGKKELIHAVKFMLSDNTCLAGMYIEPQMNWKSTKEALTTLKGGTEERTIITGDLNSRYVKWERTTNARGKATVSCATRCNYKITPKNSVVHNQRQNRESTLDLLLYLDAAEADHPRDLRWDDTSDHTPILYTVKGTNIKIGKPRISKSMLNNSRNRDEAGEQYRESILNLAEKVRRSHANE